VFDAILAVLSLGCLIAFMAILVSFVARPDLIVVTVVVLLMAAYDFYRLLTTDKPKRPHGPAAKP
jgi:hypothetical protein